MERETEGVDRVMAETVLIVAHGHPELYPGGAELAAYALFKTLRDEASVRAHFLAWGGTAVSAHVGTPFASFRGRPDETMFHSDGFDHFLFSQAGADFARYAAFLRDLRPDVIHLHHYTRIGVEFIALARGLLSDVRVVVTLHEFLAICNNFGQMIKTDGRSLCEVATPQDCAICFPDRTAADFLLRKLFIMAHFDKVDVFISPSDFVRRRYIEWGIPEGKIVRIDNGTRAFPPPPARPLVAGEGRGVFGYFGQITPFKGLLELLKAFEIVAQAPPSASAGMRLMVHGGNLEFNKPEFIETVTRALGRNSGRVLFAGSYRRQELSALMAQVDWVVVPSTWWENAPLVIEEALAHKRPVICSNIGGMAEKVSPGRDGLHFPVGNSFELAALLISAAGSPDEWSRLRTTMRSPLPMSEWMNLHLDIYREETFAVA